MPYDLQVVNHALFSSPGARLVMKWGVSKFLFWKEGDGRHCHGFFCTTTYNNNGYGIQDILSNL